MINLKKIYLIQTINYFLIAGEGHYAKECNNNPPLQKTMKIHFEN